MNDATTKSRTFRTFLMLMELEPERIRARIQQARDETGLTQAELAALLHVHKRTIENYEHVRVPWDRLNDLARILNRPAEWFIYGEEALPPEGELREIREAQLELTAGLRDVRERLDALESP